MNDAIAKINAPDQSRSTRRPLFAASWGQMRMTAEMLWQEIERNRVFTQAAAMTYKTLFSLLPIFVLALLVLSMISTGGEGSALDKAVKDMVFKQLSLDKLVVTDSSGHPATGSDGKPMTAEQLVSPLLDRAKSAVTGKATGLIAFGILLYGAISLMIVIESAFNQIYAGSGGAGTRTWLRRITLYWAVLTFGPLAVGASMVFGSYVYNVANQTLAGGWLAHPLNLLSGVLASWILLVLMYKIIPDVRVHWRPAITGALFAAILLQLGRWGFDLYVVHSVRNSWYGSLALIPLFMLWIYLTWSFILLGLLLSYIIQHYALLRRRFVFSRRGAQVIADLRWVLSLGVVLYERFKQGKTLAANDAAEMLVIPVEATRRLLDALERAGIAIATRRGEYSLARPPEQITAHDLLLAAKSVCLPPPELSAVPQAVQSPVHSRAMEEIEHLESEWAKSHTLPALAGD